MKQIFSKIVIFLLLLTGVISFMPQVASAQNADRLQTASETRTQSQPQGYVPLVRIPGITDADFTNATAIVNGLIRITVVAAALLAVIQIIRGGFMYITTEAVSTKGEAKKLISDALTGLLLILVSVLILTLVNPDILKLRLFNDRPPQRETPNYQAPSFFDKNTVPNLPPGSQTELTPLAPSNSSEPAGMLEVRYTKNKDGSIGCPDEIDRNGIRYGKQQVLVGGLREDTCLYVRR